MTEEKPKRENKEKPKARTNKIVQTNDNVVLEGLATAGD